MIIKKVKFACKTQNVCVISGILKGAHVVHTHTLANRKVFRCKSLQTYFVRVCSISIRFPIKINLYWFSNMEEQTSPFLCVTILPRPCPCFGAHPRTHASVSRYTWACGIFHHMIDGCHKKTIGPHKKTTGPRGSSEKTGTNELRDPRTNALLDRRTNVLARPRKNAVTSPQMALQE